MKDGVLCKFCFLIRINCLPKTCDISGPILKEGTVGKILNQNGNWIYEKRANNVKHKGNL